MVNKAGGVYSAVGAKGWLHGGKYPLEAGDLFM
jgi:hypothetical protein